MFFFSSLFVILGGLSVGFEVQKEKVVLAGSLEMAGGIMVQ